MSEFKKFDPRFKEDGSPGGPKDFKGLTTEETQQHFDDLRVAEAEMKEEKKSRAARSLKSVDLNRNYIKLCNVLERDINRLLDESYKRALTTDERTSLTQYLKISRDLMKYEGQVASDMSDEDLKKIARDK